MFGALFFMGMEEDFLWVGYMFGSLLNEFMEILLVDWDIVRMS